MNEMQYRIVMGGLLHDIGKVVYRSGDGRGHPESGCEFLRDAGITDEAILQQVRFHHAKELRSAALPQNSLAYITYIADNIASSADRRESEAPRYGFSPEVAQDSIFNRLNGNTENCKYAPKLLTEEINYPTNKPVAYDKQFYVQCLHSVRENLRGICLNDQYLNSLVELLEANLTYVPSSTALKETADISLFDHCKLTAAVGSCILSYLFERHITNYRDVLWKSEKSFYAQKVFLLYTRCWGEVV